jgi:hypothetical protein
MYSRARTEILTEMNVDNHHFQVTTNPCEKNSCILWFMDSHAHVAYTALGKFSSFDKRKILGFIVKYATSLRLRKEIDHRKFEAKVNFLDRGYFRSIETQSAANQGRAYRALFDLDSTIEKHDLTKRMRMLVKKFHPDAGGDTKSMALINEAYQYLLELAE